MDCIVCTTKKSSARNIQFYALVLTADLSALSSLGLVSAVLRMGWAQGWKADALTEGTDEILSDCGKCYGGSKTGRCGE